MSPLHTRLYDAVFRYTDADDLEPIGVHADPFIPDLYGVRVQRHGEDRPWDFLVRVERQVVGGARHVTCEVEAEVEFTEWPPVPNRFHR